MGEQVIISIKTVADATVRPAASSARAVCRREPCRRSPPLAVFRGLANVTSQIGQVGAVITCVWTAARRD
jgi:hypothetical protein